MLSSKIIDKFIKLFFSFHRKSNSNPSFTNIKRILVIRQHNQFGDLLASVPLFRAIKEAYPKSSTTVIVSPDNYYAITKNKFVDKTFLFYKTKMINPRYIFQLSKILKNNYDVCIVPVTVAVSTTSCILAGLSDAKLKIGPAELDGSKNKYEYLFDETVNMDWGENQGRHVADFGQDILQPLGIKTENLKSEISFDEADLEAADEFLNSFDKNGNDRLIIGLHVGAGKIPNRWASSNFAELITLLSVKYNAIFYLTGTDSDIESISAVSEKSKISKKLFLNKTVPEVAALISKSDLFITNDTGIMHVAGAVNIPQISIFGPTNPNNWAPVGENKFVLKKGNDINMVEVKDVFEIADRIFG